MTATPTPLTVTGLARRAGVAPDTVRYYERRGLLPPAVRGANGYRHYDESAVDRLLFIKGAKGLGLRLRDIAELLPVRDRGVCPCEPAESLLARRMAEVDAELARLTALRTQLATMITGMSATGCTDPLPDHWCPPPCRAPKGDDPDD